MISRAAAAETAMPSEVVPAVTTVRLLAPTAVAAPPAWDLEVEVEAGVVAVEAAVGEGRDRLPEAS